MSEYDLVQRLIALTDVEAIAVSEDGETYSLIPSEMNRIKLNKKQAIQFIKRKSSIKEIKNTLK